MKNMENNVAFIDLDGVIANLDERLAVALDTYMKSVPDELPHLRTKKYAESSDVYWQTVYRPDLVEMDTLIDGVADALEQAKQSFEIILLTSRPESMREATERWLQQHDITAHSRLIMKSPAAQYVKSSVWKALTLDTIAVFLSASEVVFVDDEPANISEAVKHKDESQFHLRTYASLQAMLGNK